MTKILLVHPGADSSTSDVYDGLLPALQRQGAEVIEYPLGQRIGRVANWLKYNYRRAKRADPTIPEPTFHDTLYLAAERALPIALMEGVDWVVAVSGMYLLKYWVYLMRRAGLRVGLVLSESPYDDAEQCQVTPYANVVWTNERTSVAFLKLVNRHTHYLPHAHDPARHTPVADDAEDVPAHDVVFVGSAFSERIEALDAVDWDGIDLGLYGNWQMLPSRHRLRRFVRGGQVPNAEAAALYRRAKVGLNLYRRSRGFRPDASRVVGAASLNPRALELAACGVFTVSDHRPEVSEVFGDLVPTFERAEDLGPLLRRWLTDDAGRAEVAAQLPGCVRDRSFDAMAAQVLNDLEAYGCAGAAMQMQEVAG